MILLYFIPFILYHYYNKELIGFKYIKLIWIPLALVCSLSGPLNPGIALIFSLLLLIHILSKNIASKENSTLINKFIAGIKGIPTNYYFFLVPICLFSLYSLYLGKFSTIEHGNQISLIVLYSRLPKGVFYQFTQKLGFPVLFIILFINTLIIRTKFNNFEGKKILNIFKWIGIFALVYILLLPLGGYKSYRPNILRYDTIIPLTLCFVFIFGKTTIFIINNISNLQKYWYLALVLFVIFIYTNADKPEFDKNNCEKRALIKISESTDSIVKIDNDCNVLSWDKINTPKDSELEVQLLQVLGILNEKKLYYQ